CIHPDLFICLSLPKLMNKPIGNSKRCQYKKLLLKHCSINSMMAWQDYTRDLQSKDVVKALKKWIGHRNPKVQLLALSIYSSILKDSYICPLPESVVPFDVYGVEDFKIEDTNVHNPTTHKFQEDPKSDPRHYIRPWKYLVPCMREDLFARITGLTNNSYFDGAHEVRHYLRKHSDLGRIVLEVAKVYVSTVQANNYPITCTQWHPEKAIFEWRKPMIPHSEDAIQVTQHFANHFI
ncbi:hypothetical protein ACJX0J_006189, partial [Zea mays]